MGRWVEGGEGGRGKRKGEGRGRVGERLRVHTLQLLPPYLALVTMGGDL